MVVTGQPTSEVQPAGPGAAPDPPSGPQPPTVDELMKRAETSYQKTEEASGAQAGLTKQKLGLIEEREILIAEPFLILSQILFMVLVVLASSAIILVLFVLRASKSCDAFTLWVLEPIIWIVLPLVALLIGYYSGIHSRNSAH